MTMVIKGKGSRRERKHVVLRSRIISTAADLFARHGFANVTVDHIADVADIGKGTVYNYFQAKEDILVAYTMDNKVEVLERECSDPALTLRGKPIPYQIRRQIGIHR